MLLNPSSGFLAFLPSIILAPAASGAEPSRRPNVVFILTDNQGAWTLGCYGNKDIRTPNIDKLAAEGVRFTRALASNPVCSPTRATYLTGLIPSQHGVHSYLTGEKNGVQMGENAYCTIREFTTLPKSCAMPATSVASAASGTSGPTSRRRKASAPGSRRRTATRWSFTTPR